MKKYIEYLIVAFLLLFTILVFFSPLLSLSHISPGADMVNLFYPMKTLSYEWLHRGTIVLWDPYSFCGRPFFATYQPALLYPFDFVMGQIVSPELGLLLYRIVHLWMLGFFSYLLLRKGLTRGFVSSLTGAFAATFSYFTLGHLEHINQLASISWLPLLIYLMLRLFDYPHVRRILLLGLVFGVQLLAGHPQYSAYFTLLVILYSVWYLVVGNGVKHSMVIKRLLGRLVPIGGVIAGLLLGLGLSGVQTLPSKELSVRSYRAFHDYNSAAEYSMNPKYCLLFLNPSAYGSYEKYLLDHQEKTEAADETDIQKIPNPDNIGEKRCYIGILSLLFVAAGVVEGVRRRGRTELFFIGLLLLSLLLSFGSFTPVFRFCCTIFPFLEQFRVPPRFLSLFLMSALVLCSSGIDGLFRWNFLKSFEGKKWKYIFSLLIPLILFGDLFLASRKDMFHFPVSLETLESQVFPYRVMTNDASDFRVFRLMWRDVHYYEQSLPESVAIRSLRLQPDLNVNSSIQSLDGYEGGLNPTVRYKDFLFYFNRNFRRPTPDIDLLTLMNVKYMYTESPVVSPHLKRLEGVNPETGDPYVLFENLLWRGGVFSFDTIEEQVNLSALEGRYYTEGLLQSELGNEVREYLKTSQLRIHEVLRLERATPNMIQITKPVDMKGDLILSQASYPGWYRIREGKNGSRQISRKPIEPINAIMSRVPASEGETTINLRYEPFSFRMGMFLSLWVLLVVVVGLICGGGKKIRTL